MKKSSKLIVSLALLLTLLSTMIHPYAFADWTTTIYEEKNEEFIGKGVKHEHLLRFTDSGWLNIHVLRANISDQDVSLDLLLNQNGIGTREKLSQIVNQSEHVVGAINGDFFNTQGAAALGPMVKDGELITTPFYIPEQMATFNVTKDEQPFITNWTLPQITVTNTSTQSTLSIGAVNKETEQPEIAVIYTAKWGYATPPLSSKLTSAVEMAVSNGIVQGIYPAGSTGNPIPGDGYVVFATGAYAAQIQEFFSVGDSVTYSNVSDLNIENLALSMGGGAVLVKNGTPLSSFTHDIKGNNPRTALGISQDRKEVILVTIDGRTSSFTGVSQIELAQIMSSLGAYDAINLDGGGSTDMVLRPLGDQNKIVVNNLSDGAERRITNGIGIVSTAPKTQLKGIKLQSKDQNVFINTPRKLTVTGYDENYNPVSVDFSNVKWQVSGVSGTVSSGVFVPTSPGKATITAEYAGAQAVIEMRALDNPSALVLAPSQLNLAPNGQASIQVKAVDSMGYSASVEAGGIRFDVPTGLGSMNGSNVFTASGQSGTGIITASYGELKAYLPVVVGSQETLIHDFEKINGSFLSYPAEVTGSYGLSPFGKSGQFAGDLAYDFTTTDATRAAYLVFDNNGIVLDKRPEKIGLWVYGNEGGGHALKAKITDSTGVSENITLSNTINWQGWSYVEAKVPESLKAPIRLERIYLVQINPAYKNAGRVYLDQLTASYPMSFQGTVPAPVTKAADSRNTKAELEGKSSFRFFAHGKVAGIDTLLDNMTITKMADTVNQTASLNIFTESIDASLSSQLKNPVMLADSGYSYTKYGSSGFIKLDNSKGGLRETNWNQWPWLLQTLETIDAKNIFITLPKQLTFKDKLEEKLFTDTLEKLREDKGVDVWVLYGGKSSYEVKLEDGIHYVALKSYPEVDAFDIFTQLDTMIFTVNDNKVTYEILPLYGK
ncbi:MAG: phosphodiester glycosidase family protein [Bacillota bacterium]